MATSMKGRRRRGGPFRPLAFPQRTQGRASVLASRSIVARPPHFACPWPLGVRKLTCAGSGLWPRKQASPLQPVPVWSLLAIIEILSENYLNALTKAPKGRSIPAQGKAKRRPGYAHPQKESSPVRALYRIC